MLDLKDLPVNGIVAGGKEENETLVADRNFNLKETLFFLYLQYSFFMLKWPQTTKKLLYYCCCFLFD